jgi:hypothetical protein
VILVMNTAFGKPELLPFDLRRKRITPYSLPEPSDDKAKQREGFVKTLEAGLRLILAKVPASPPPPDLLTEATTAIKSGRADQGPAVRDAMKALTDQIAGLQPTPQQQVFADDVLVETLPKAIPIVLDFARLADVAARYDSKDAVVALAKGLQPVLDGYFDVMRGKLSIVDDERGLSQFVGHELVVAATAILMRHGRWEQLRTFLGTKYVVDTSGGRQTVGFEAFSSCVHALGARTRRLKLNRALLHADFLKDRHSAGELGALVPFRDFIEADTFLFLAAELPPTSSPTQECESPCWRPWSAIYLERFSSPRFLDEMEDESLALAVARVMGFVSVDAFKTRYAERAATGLKAMFRGTVHSFEPRLAPVEKIGSRR